MNFGIITEKNYMLGLDLGNHCETQKHNDHDHDLYLDLGFYWKATGCDRDQRDCIWSW
jgi:hypothetical protein